MLAPGPLVAGAERVVLAGARALAATGISCAVVALEAVPGGTDAFVDVAREMDVDVAVIPAPGSLDLRAAWRVRELCRAFDAPPLLHAHGYRALALCRAVCPGGSRVVATVHGFTSHDRRARMYERVERALCRGLARVVAVSDALEEQLLGSGVAAERVVVVDNPIPREMPMPRARDIRSATPRLLFLGRISHEKGLDVLLRALSLTADLPWALDVMGDGPQRRESEELARSLSLADRVHFLGFTDTVPEALGAADLVVLPSRTEGTPLTLLEAMASGRPVVASDVGGVGSALSHGAGLLVAPDSPNALARALRAALANRSALEAIALRRSDSVRLHFAAERWAQDMGRVYADVEEALS
jgi:glycosyltransferase involved in cell wall biosynthesis